MVFCLRERAINASGWAHRASIRCAKEIEEREAEAMGSMDESVGRLLRASDRRFSWSWRAALWRDRARLSSGDRSRRLRDP